MSTTVTSSVARDNLFAGTVPRVKRGVRTIGESQTIVRGTVLGVDVAAAGSVTPDGGNTGDGVVGALALLGDAKVGDYVLTCVEAITNSGRFRLVDPDGLFLGEFTLPVSSNVTVKLGGISFNVADGATDFAVGDFVTLAVDAGSGNSVKLDAAAVDGSADIDAIALEDVTTGAGESAEIAVALQGDFQSQGITLGGSTTIADIEAAARLKQIFFATSFANNNVVGG